MSYLTGRKPCQDQIDAFGAGNVLAFTERNGHSDSDFSALYAVRADDGSYSFKWRETATTRFGGGFMCTPDASDEVLSAYRSRRNEVLGQYRAECDDERSRMIEKGATVTVVKARTRGKSPIAAGTQGVVFWRGVDEYATGAQALRYGQEMLYQYRIGIKVDGATVWLPEKSVRVTGREDEPVGKVDSMIGYLIAGSWPNV